jgi:hypothetical protein
MNMQVCTGAPFEINEVECPVGEFLTTETDPDSGAVIVESSKGTVKEIFIDVIAVYPVEEGKRCYR